MQYLIGPSVSTKVGISIASEVIASDEIACEVTDAKLSVDVGPVMYLVVYLLPNALAQGHMILWGIWY